MKKFYTLLIALAIGSTFTFGQVSLDSLAVTPVEYNDTMTYYAIDPSTFDPGPSGADVEWDFSAVDSTRTTFGVFTEYDPNTTIDSKYKNLPIVPTFRLLVDSTFHFYKSTESSLHYIGRTVVENTDDRQDNVYKPALEFFSFPSSINETNSETITNSDYSTFLYPLSRTGRMDGTINSEIDASGTLTLPFTSESSISGVLRIKYTEDLTENPNASDPYNRLEELQTTVYEWREPFTKAPIIRYSEEVWTVDQPIGTSTDTTFTKTTIYTLNRIHVVNVNELIESSEDFVLYPNPAPDNATVKIDLDQTSDITIEVVNIMGAVVHRIEKENIRPGNFTENLNISHLDRGQYLIKLSINGEVQAQKIQKL